MLVPFPAGICMSCRAVLGVQETCDVCEGSVVFQITSYWAVADFERLVCGRAAAPQLAAGGERTWLAPFTDLPRTSGVEYGAGLRRDERGHAGVIVRGRDTAEDLLCARHYHGGEIVHRRASTGFL